MDFRTSGKFNEQINKYSWKKPKFLRDDQQSQDKDLENKYNLKEHCRFDYLNNERDESAYQSTDESQCDDYHLERLLAKLEEEEKYDSDKEDLSLESVRMKLGLSEKDIGVLCSARKNLAAVYEGSSIGGDTEDDRGEESDEEYSANSQNESLTDGYSQQSETYSSSCDYDQQHTDDGEDIYSFHHDPIHEPTEDSEDSSSYGQRGRRFSSSSGSYNSESNYEQDIKIVSEKNLFSDNFGQANFVDNVYQLHNGIASNDYLYNATKTKPQN